MAILLSLCSAHDTATRVFICGGTWSGATVAMNCSNDESLAQFDPAYDPEGTDIVQTENRKPWIMYPNTYAIMPVMTGSAPGTSIIIAVMGRGNKE